MNALYAMEYDIAISKLNKQITPYSIPFHVDRFVNRSSISSLSFEIVIDFTIDSD